MKWHVAQRMEQLPKQFFATLVGRVSERIAEGRDVINLGQGNPDLPTPAHIVERLREAALDPQNHRYAPFSGLPALKAAAAEFYRREYGVNLDPEHEVAILFGGKTGLVEISTIYLNPGDLALVPDPGYPDYWSGIAFAGGVMETLPLTAAGGFLPDYGSVPAATLDRAKLLFLNYPNNPTGAVADLAFFKETVRVAARHGILVVHDFAYGAIGYDGFRPPSFLQAEGAKEVGIEIYTLSKTYNMAGWRVAFAVGNPDVIRAINLLQDHYYVSLFPAVQWAAVEALTGPQDAVHALREVYQRRRDAFIGTLREAGYACEAPRGTFFAWLPTPPGVGSATFANDLLDRADVAVAPGVGFGPHGEGYVRVGLLTDEARLREAARRIAQVVARC